MKNVILLIALVATFSVVVAQPRIDKIIDSDWRFTRANAAGAESPKYSDSRWERISLPHTWNALDGQDGGNDYYRGVGWYRKHITLDKSYRGKSVFLKFDGAGTTAHVYVNGSLAGMHKGNFGAFCFDVSSLVTVGRSNLIAVRVSNAKDTTVAPLRGDFTIFGGLYRSVHLLLLEKLSISPLDYASPGVYLKQTDVSTSRADVEVTTIVRNANAIEKQATIRCTVKDRLGKSVGTVESSLRLDSGSQVNHVQKVTLRSPRLWNGRKDPYLYEAVVEVFENKTLVDRLAQPLGLRFFLVDPERGFILNGESFPLHGVNRHQDREDKGWALGLRDHQEDYRLIEEIGASTVRLAHYQHAQEFYDLCDRGGMAVWAELALVDEIHPCAEFALGCKEQLKELIKQNFNHPSIFFWSIFNELMPEANRELYGNLVLELNTLAKQLDPTRLTTMASRSRYEANEYINTVADVVGYNVYRGWYEGMPQDFAGFVDTIHERFPKLSFCISEYGAGAGLFQHEYPAKKPNTKGSWHPEEWQATYHEVHWRAMAERPYLWGTFIWNMFDFASDGRREGEQAGINDKGLVTHDRKVKKDAFYWYKANWNPEPMVHITSKRFTPRPAGETEVKVYSNCDSLSLSVNGRVLGTRTNEDRLFVWKQVDLVSGSNSIEAVGYRNGKMVKDSCSWVTIQDEAKGQTSR